MSVAALIEAGPAAAATAQARCAHCGERLASGAADFCCSGCAAAYRLIEELGLGRYYGGRRLDPQTRLPRPPDEPAADATAAVTAADGTSSLELMIDGLHCAACVWLIERALTLQSEVSRRASI